jgi:hypothetical protein
VIPECLQVQEEMVYLREYEGPMNALLGSEACSRLEKVNLTSTQDNQLIKLPPTVKELSVRLPSFPPLASFLQLGRCS